MTDQIDFETPEDVVLSFDLAGPASRLAAALLDYFLIVGLIVAVILTMASAGVIAFQVRDLFDPQAWSQIGGFAIAVMVAAAFAINLLYFMLLEWLANGQTLGKRALGLRVVRDGGYALGFGPAFLRNLMRPVDMIPLFYVVGMVAVLASEQRKRIGDQVAGTLVVRHAHVTAPAPRFVGESYAQLADRKFAFEREPLLQLGRDALTLLDDYYDRFDKVGPAYRDGLTARVAGGLAHQLGIEPGEHPERFLKELYLALRET